MPPTNTKMNYDLLKPLYQAFDEAEQVLKDASDKLQNAAADTANNYFTGLVGPSYQKKTEDLCKNLEAFRQKILTYHDDLGKAEQSIRQADTDGAQDVRVAK